MGWHDVTFLHYRIKTATHRLPAVPGHPPLTGCAQVTMQGVSRSNRLIGRYGNPSLDPPVLVGLLFLLLGLLVQKVAAIATSEAQFRPESWGIDQPLPEGDLPDPPDRAVLGARQDQPVASLRFRKGIP